MGSGLNLDDVFKGDVVSVRAHAGDTHIHRSGCRDVKPGKYDVAGRAVHQAGDTGEDIVREWFDNGILDEAVADVLYESPDLPKSDVELNVLEDYTHEFEVLPCADKLR
jgi:hypothetical protein